MNNILVCQISLGCCFLGMLFIFLRSLPLLLEFEPKPVPKEEKFFFKVKRKCSSIQKKVKDSFNHWQERSLRKTRVWILRIDNSLTSYLEKIRRQKIHFSKKREKEEKQKK